MRWIPVLGSLFLLCGIAPCQEVVSAYAGTVHYFEGAVFIDDRPLEHKAAIFQSIPNGSVFRTAEGRAEVLLSPGVVLRLDEDSSVRMISNALTDTRIEFVKGSALLDTLAASGTAAVVVSHQSCRIRFPKPGIYRLDSDTDVLQAYDGEAEVTGPEGKISKVDTSKLFFFDLAMVTNKFGEPNEDAFYDWSRGRADALAAENQLAEQSMDNGADQDNAPFLWNTPVPYIGNSPTYSIFDGTYYTGSLFNPWGFGASPFPPFGVWPVVVLNPRHYGQYRPWPHRPVSGSLATGYPGITQSPLRYPVFTPRPAAGTTIRPSRPATYAAPHPAAPAAHPVFHR
jgi:hypothetical protein